MRFWQVGSRIPVSHQRMDMFHVTMFHGYGDREGLPDSLYEPTERYPLLVSRNTYRMPDIFKPRGVGSVHPVVSRRFADRLRDMPHLRFVPVRFVRLFRIPWALGDLSYRKLWPQEEAWDQYLRGLKHDPALEKEVGEYFELVPPVAYQIKSEFTDLIDYTIDEPEHPDGFSVVSNGNQVRLSATLLAKYPVAGLGPLIFRDDVFQRIADLVDKDFFGTNVGDIEAHGHVRQAKTSRQGHSARDGNDASTLNGASDPDDFPDPCDSPDPGAALPENPDPDEGFDPATLSFTRKTRVVLAPKYPIRSLIVPDHHTWDPAYGGGGGWIKRAGVDDSVVVEAFALSHEDVLLAQNPQGPFRDLIIDGRTWRYRRRRYRLFFDVRRYIYQDEFQAMLMRSDCAVVLHGDLNWTDADVRAFARRMKMR